jgi:hypothetical protein
MQLRNAFASVLLGAGLALAALTPARADDFYLGAWKITAAQVAPWVKPGESVDDAESKMLVGKTITLSKDAVAGPGDFPCAKPKYEVIEGGPDMLFQGTFGQMHDDNPAVDPQKLADDAGFKGKAFKTVITGCEYEVDFSWGADPDTAMFGLNNYLYTLKRQ